jgi:hypothetical protein
LKYLPASSSPQYIGTAPPSFTVMSFSVTCPTFGTIGGASYRMVWCPYIYTVVYVETNIGVEIKYKRV